MKSYGRSRKTKKCSSKVNEWRRESTTHQRVTSFIRSRYTWLLSNSGFQPGNISKEAKSKEVQFQMFISVPQIAGVPGFVTFTDAVYIQYLYSYIGLNDMIQTTDLNWTMPQRGRHYMALGVSSSPLALHSDAVDILAYIWVISWL